MRRMRGPRSTASVTSSPSGTTPGMVSNRGGNGNSNFIKSVMRVSPTREAPQRWGVHRAVILIGMLVRLGRTLTEPDPAQDTAECPQTDRDKHALRQPGAAPLAA